MLPLTAKQIQQFWHAHTRFLKTSLITETPHPLTWNLSNLCQTNLVNAFRLFQQVEVAAIKQLLAYSEDIYQLHTAIYACLNQGGKIFLIGCGASGRLAILLKRLYATYYPNKHNQVINVSAGGDISLIKAVEQFEDQAKLGILQLKAQGFSSQDLAIGLTASGESPFILAAINYAANNSQHTPWLVFNNPIASLIKRNPQHLLASNQIKPLALTVGPMALTGSTRLQATTAMQIAVGLALCSPNLNYVAQIKQLAHLIATTSLENLASVTQAESIILAKQEFLLYQTNDSLLGLNLLADLTERAPTFNLIPFENNNELSNMPSPFYLSLTHASTALNAWELLLGQKPTCLNWQQFPTTMSHYIQGFNLSATSPRAKGIYLPQKQHCHSWQVKLQQLEISLNALHTTLPLPLDPLQATLIYKLCLNSHSTLMFGSLNYYEGNMMLYLKPSNFKLIDRAIRYSQFILQQQHHLNINYNHLAEIVFEEIKQLQANQSIVKKVVAHVVKSFN